MAETTHREQADLRDRSTAELVRHLTEQVSTLVREEVGLARQEIRQKGKRAGAGAGALSMAAVLALYGGGGLLAAVTLGIAQALRPWLAALIVGVALLALAGMAAVVGRASIRRSVPPVPKQAMDSVREDVDTVRERIYR